MAATSLRADERELAKDRPKAVHLQPDKVLAIIDEQSSNVLTMATPLSIPVERGRPRTTDFADSLHIPAQLSLLSGQQEISARLIQVDQGLLKLIADNTLAQDSIVKLEIDGCPLKARVVSCEPDRLAKFVVILRRIYSTQGAVRSEPRIPVDLSAILTSALCDRTFARIVDMSQSGLGFELPYPLLLGTRVSVQFVSGIAFGKIKHCAAQKAVYRAGMRIEEFVVRRDRASAQVNVWYSERNFKASLGQRALTFARKALCSVTGHKYEWSTDSWERAILRCTSCAKLLSP